MRQTKRTDQNFDRKHDAPDRRAVEKILAASRGDIRRTVEELTELRERIRDDEIARLEREADRLLDKVDSLERDKLVEELRCFRDVLSFYRDAANESR